MTEAFDAYFRRMFPRAIVVGRRVTGGTESGRDAAAEAFVHAYMKWHRVSQLPWRDAWVLKVAYREALRQQRRRRSTPEPDHLLSDDSDAIATRLALVSALALLPRRQREAIGLRYLADLSEEEVAEALGISRGSVKTHVHRGLATLRVSAHDFISEGGIGHELAK